MCVIRSPAEILYPIDPKIIVIELNLIEFIIQIIIQMSICY